MQLEQTPQGVDVGPSIQAARQNARYRCFARAALARKDVAVRQTSASDGVGQRFLNVFLPEKISKRLRTVFPSDDLIHESLLIQ